MNFDYYFENTEFGVRFHVLPNIHIKGDLFMIEEWLFGDVQNSSYFLERMKNFIESTEMEEDELGGNACDVFVKRDFSTIKWIYHDQVSSSCTLPTEMLYEILQIWVKKKAEIREKE